MKIIYTFFIFCYTTVCFAQLHDNTWIFGYSNNPDTTDKYGISVLTFPDGDLVIQQNVKITLNFNCSNSAFSDSSGKLHSYSNALHIGNTKGAIMGNGEFIIDGVSAAGGVFDQATMALPFPGWPNKYLYLYNNYQLLPIIGDCGTFLRYCIVDKTANAGLGEVIARDISIVEDTIATGGVITAVKHANGRDWWLLCNKAYSNIYYRILITPAGPQIMGMQEVGTPIKLGAGQVAFSPDGSHYANYYAISQQLGGYLEIYDFDRCTGLLSNHRSKHIPDGSWGGIAFSPNSRYLYYNNTFTCYQYDMQSPDVFSSEEIVAQWDNYQSPFPAAFFLMQLAPDRKIYIATPTGCDVLHVIQRPDEPGIACRYEQHAVQLPTYNAHSMPNFPNYRLGPLDGSACDTLGLDNLPVAWFRYDRDTLDAWSVEFRDLSYYAPDSWSWDFGDGSAGSTEQHPWHTFTESGNYTVCLTVSNENSSDTYCRTLFVGVLSSEDLSIEQSNIAIIPNPANDYLRITGLSLADGEQASIILLDVNGKRVAEHTLNTDQTGVATHALPEGIYFCRIMVDHQLVAIRRVVIIH